MAEMAGASPRPRVPRGTLIGGLVALVSFLLLLPLIAALAQRTAPPAVQSGGARTPVVVAAKNLSARQTLAAGDLAIKQMYRDDVPAGAFTRIDQARGMTAAASLSAGQPITAGLVVKPKADTPQSDIPYLPLPNGHVATTVPTSEQQGVAGYIRPGDYISVVAVVPTSAGQQSSNARTVLTNLYVIRVGLLPQKASSSQTGQTGQTGQGQTDASSTLSSLTLMVTECEAELLNWFLANAQVRYTLQSYKDYQQQLPAGADQTCPSVNSAQGITRSDIARRYPGIFNQ
jgi:Flp pilus assembly protein CpaB